MIVVSFFLFAASASLILGCGNLFDLDKNCE